jgi:hypothetical protein
MEEELKKALQSVVANEEDIKKDLTEIKKMVKSIKNHFIRDEIFSFLRLLIIIVPLVIGAIYLMPIVEKSMQQYQQILGLSTDIGSGKVDINNVDIGNVQKYITPEVMKQLENLNIKK